MWEEQDTEDIDAIIAYAEAIIEICDETPHSAESQLGRIRAEALALLNLANAMKLRHGS